jgi:FAD/FMN-containing dehydrogenase
MTLGDSDWAKLRRSIDGVVVRANAPDYDDLRKPTMVRFQAIRPEAVVRCTSPEDVAATIAFAKRHRFEMAVRSGGHSVAGSSSTTGIVLDVTPMNGVSIDGELATVGAGARLGPLEDALEPSGRTIPAGSSHSVGIAGLTLGGGLGVLGRRYGLTSDHLLSAQVVLADGRIVGCDEQQHADLFWALRGAGGGSLGVVTSLVFRTVRAPGTTVFHLVWPFDRAVGLVEVWQAWVMDAPDELDATLRLHVAGDGAETTADVFGAVVGTDVDTVGLLDDFVARVRAEPASTSVRHLSYREAKRALDDPPPHQDARAEPRRPASASAEHLFTKSEFFRGPLPADAIATLVAGLLEAPAGAELREVAFLPWGGAYNRVPADDTAFVHRDERFLIQHLVSFDPEIHATGGRSARAWLARSWGIVHPWGSGGVYPNFPDPDVADAYTYYGRNTDRVLRVKAGYDPDGFFPGLR